MCGAPISANADIAHHASPPARLQPSWRRCRAVTSAGAGVVVARYQPPNPLGWPFLAIAACLTICAFYVVALVATAGALNARLR
jgi:hypothetical protein